MQLLIVLRGFNDCEACNNERNLNVSIILFTDDSRIAERNENFSHSSAIFASRIITDGYIGRLIHDMVVRRELTIMKLSCRTERKEKSPWAMVCFKRGLHVPQSIYTMASSLFFRVLCIR